MRTYWIRQNTHIQYHRNNFCFVFGICEVFSAHIQFCSSSYFCFIYFGQSGFLRTRSAWGIGKRSVAFMASIYNELQWNEHTYTRRWNTATPIAFLNWIHTKREREKSHCHGVLHWNRSIHKWERETYRFIIQHFVCFNAVLLARQDKFVDKQEFLFTIENKRNQDNAAISILCYETKHTVTIDNKNNIYTLSALTIMRSITIITISGFF